MPWAWPTLLNDNDRWAAASRASPPPTPSPGPSTTRWPLPCCRAAPTSQLRVTPWSPTRRTPTWTSGPCSAGAPTWWATRRPTSPVSSTSFLQVLYRIYSVYEKRLNTELCYSDLTIIWIIRDNTGSQLNLTSELIFVPNLKQIDRLSKDLGVQLEIFLGLNARHLVH